MVVEDVVLEAKTFFREQGREGVTDAWVRHCFQMALQRRKARAKEKSESSLSRLRTLSVFTQRGSWRLARAKVLLSVHREGIYCTAGTIRDTPLMASDMVDDSTPLSDMPAPQTETIKTRSSE